MSLRRNIVALGAGSATAVLLLLVPAVVISNLSSARSESQQDAITVAQGVADFASAGATSATTLSPYVERVNGRGNRTPVTVQLPDGTVLGDQSRSCDPDASTVGSDADGRGGRGGRDGRDDDLNPVSPALVQDTTGGQLVQITTPSTAGAIGVCAFVADSDVTESVLERTAPVGLAALAILAAVVAAALVVARRMARHLTTVSATAERLGDGDLTARAPVAGPEEVQRVGMALNRLAARIDDLLTLERETVADLSHRLRTPMMTVRLDVEALPESPGKAELSGHLGQLERTLTAVIQAARRGEREGAVPRCDVVAVVQDRYAYWAPLIEDQGRAAGLTVAPGVMTPVRCARDDLASALDALLENAVAHTEDGVAVRVVVSGLADGWTQVDVGDQGPGVPLDSLQRGRSDRGSSGLGLDIARGCAESTGGSLVLTADGDWSIVRLILGPAEI